MPLLHLLFFGMLLFLIGILGVLLNRKNLLIMLMSIEIMLLSANNNFILFATYHGMQGRIIAFTNLTIAAAEAAVGLSILILIFKQKDKIELKDLNQVRG